MRVRLWQQFATVIDDLSLESAFHFGQIGVDEFECRLPAGNGMSIALVLGWRIP